MSKILIRFSSILFIAGVFINANGQVKTKTFEKGIPANLIPVKSLNKF